jgi:hypothetical protein
LHLQKAKELPAGRPDLHIPQELGKACSSRIGLTRAINSHPTRTILYNYSDVKEKVRRYRNWKAGVRGCKGRSRRGEDAACEWP